MSLRKIRVVDTETTGLPENGPVEIVEIGWTDILEGMDGSLIVDDGPRSRLCKPEIRISYGAMATHHITEAMAAQGIDQNEIAGYLGDADIYAAHNATFDKPLLDLEWRAPWICTLKCARHLWPDLDSHSNGAIRYALNLCLSAIDQEKATPAHRAGPDTWITAKLLIRLSEELTVDEMIEISANPSRILKMPFGKHRGKRLAEIPDDYLHWIVTQSDMRDDPKHEDIVFSAREELRARP